MTSCFSSLDANALGTVTGGNQTAGEVGLSPPDTDGELGGKRSRALGSLGGERSDAAGSLGGEYGAPYPR